MKTKIIDPAKRLARILKARIERDEKRAVVLRVYAVRLPDGLNQLIGAFRSDDDASLFAYLTFGSYYDRFDLCAIGDFSPVGLLLRPYARPILVNSSQRVVPSGKGGALAKPVWKHEPTKER